jgi:hypothetical protein
LQVIGSKRALFILSETLSNLSLMFHEDYDDEDDETTQFCQQYYLSTFWIGLIPHVLRFFRRSKVVNIAKL